MHATFAREGLATKSEASFRASFPPEHAAPLLLVPPVAEPSVYGARTGPNWPAIGGILAAHAALLFALVSLDVIDLAPPKPAPLVVDLLSLDPPPPPPPASVTPEVAPVRPPVPLAVAPPPIVETPAAPPPIAVVAAPPPPQAVVVAPAPAKSAAVAAPVSVDLSANLLVARSPRYPTESRRRREQGTVLLQVVVGTDGSVSEIGVARSSGSERLDKAALEAVRRWRWSPTMQAGQAVQVRGVVEIPFMLQG